MGYHPRIECKKITTFQTTRSRCSELWFVNNQTLEQEILGYAAKYAARYKVKLYTMAIEGNHIQFPTRFPKANWAHFMRDFNPRWLGPFLVGNPYRPQKVLADPRIAGAAGAPRSVNPFCGVLTSCKMVQKKGRPSALLPLAIGQRLQGDKVEHADYARGIKVNQPITLHLSGDSIRSFGSGAGKIRQLLPGNVDRIVL